jgi:hypothetical protein
MVGHQFGSPGTSGRGKGRGAMHRPAGMRHPRVFQLVAAMVVNDPASHLISDDGKVRTIIRIVVNF